MSQTLKDAKRPAVSSQRAYGRLDAGLYRFLLRTLCILSPQNHFSGRARPKDLQFEWQVQAVIGQLDPFGQPGAGAMVFQLVRKMRQICPTRLHPGDGF